MLRSFNSIKNSITFKIFIPVFFASSVLIILLGLIEIKSQKKMITSFIVKDGRSLSGLLSENVKLGVYGENSDMLHQAIQPTSQQPDVIMVKVFNKEGKNLYSWHSESPNSLNVKETSLAKNKTYKSISYIETPSTFEFWSPVQLSVFSSGGDDIYVNDNNSKKEIIGYTLIVFSKKGMTQEIKRLINSNTQRLFLFLILSALISFYIIRVVSKPLSSIVKIAKPHSSPTPHTDEITFLSDTYSSMVETLTESIQTINNLQEDLLSSQETERKRIAFDLHDQIAQELSAARIKCDTLFADYQDPQHSLSEKNKEISLAIKNCIASVRELAYGLRPPDLDQLGLAITIFEYCKEFAENNNLELDFYSAGIDKNRYDYSIEINIYRILQEILNNVKQHANAKSLTVKLLANHPNILLRVEDDGDSFNAEVRQKEALQEKRMGLEFIKQRAHLLNGQVKINSKPGEGTKILVEIPYERT